MERGTVDIVGEHDGMRCSAGPTGQSLCNAYAAQFEPFAQGGDMPINQWLCVNLSTCFRQVGQPKDAAGAPYPLRNL